MTDAVCLQCGHPVGPDGMCRGPQTVPGVTCKCSRPRTGDAE